MVDSRGVAGRGALALVLVVALAVIGVVVWQRRDDGFHGPDRIVPREPGTRPDTVLFGDSVTDQTRDAFHDALATDGTERVVAFPGITTTQLLKMADEEIARRQDAGGPFDRAVFLIGYNDLMRNQGRGESVDGLLGVGDRFRCVLWLTLPEDAAGRQGPGALMAKGAATDWNEMVRVKVADHGATRIVDGWQRAVEADRDAKLLKPDGVHPSPEGQRVLAGVVADALAKTCR